METVSSVPVSFSSFEKLITSANVLLIGAGGIGCEVLKNLVTTGFTNIEIIDLDTIDVSNLNRQFLFRQEHVGLSKAKVAKEAVLQFKGNLNIVAHHDTIFSQNFGVNYFKKFKIVINALDNLQARNHVNRMCLAADVPLIESGSAGYSGQLELIKKNLTPCYECRPKPTQQTYPGCTIRNTPSEPVHCIVWAKHLFNQLFGEEDPDQDVSPDTEDPEIKKDTFTDADSEIIKRTSTRKWAQENNYDAQKLFNKFFNEDINYLLSMEDLWKTRLPPLPLTWKTASDLKDENDEETIDDVYKLWSINNCRQVFETTLNKLKSELVNQSYLCWDKDDKTCMDFVVACANIRSHIFSIQKKTSFEIKSIAGNIIPAIATANATIAGLVVLYCIRVLKEEYSRCSTIYLRQKSSVLRAVLATDSHLLAPNSNCYVCAPSPSVNIYVDTYETTVKQFESIILKEALNIVAPDVILDGQNIVIISSEEGETDCNYVKKLKEVGVVDGSILKVDDFLQNYEITLLITHYKPKSSDEPPFKVIADPNGVKHNFIDHSGDNSNNDNNTKKVNELKLNNITQSKSVDIINNSNKVHNKGDEDDDDGDDVLFIKFDTDNNDPQEGASSSKRMKLNTSEPCSKYEDEELIFVFDDDDL